MVKIIIGVVLGMVVLVQGVRALRKPSPWQTVQVGVALAASRWVGLLWFSSVVGLAAVLQVAGMLRWHVRMRRIRKAAAARRQSTIGGIGRNPQDLAVSADGRHAYIVARGGGGTLTIADLGARTVLQKVRLGFKPHAVVSLDTSRVLVGGAAGMVVVDPAKGSIVQAITDVGVVLSLTGLVGESIYMAAAEPGSRPRGKLYRLDAATLHIQASIPLGEGEPSRIAVNPRRGELYIANYTTDSIIVVDEASLAGTRLITGTLPRPYRLACNHERDRLYVLGAQATHRRYIAVIDTVTHHTMTTLSSLTSESVTGLDVSPDGRLLVSDLDAGQITAVDPEGSTVLETVAIGSILPRDIVADAKGYVHLTTYQRGGRLESFQLGNITALSGSAADGAAGQSPE